MGAKGEIVINEKLCKSCGLCAHFCPNGCISMSSGKLSPQGFVVADFAEPEKCTGCGICGWMCPDLAIEVYRFVKTKS